MSRGMSWVIFGIGALLIGVTLWAWGQPLICTCGEVKLWIGSVFDSGNSQHIADWYTLSHIIHGLLIALIWKAALPRLPYVYVFAIAFVTGVAWEIVEHTDWVLNAFRATTINQGYIGDSVLNAVADYFWMMGGFALGCTLRPVATLIIMFGFEALAAFVARDSLILTTLMLVYPVEAVEVWQQELNPRSQGQ